MVRLRWHGNDQGGRWRKVYKGRYFQRQKRDDETMEESYERCVSEFKIWKQKIDKGVQVMNGLHESADGYELKPGMVVWCDNGVIGYPPVRRVVGTLLHDRPIFHYPEPDEDGFLGCRCMAAWVEPRLAMLHALTMDTRYNLDRPEPSYVLEKAENS